MDYHPTVQKIRDILESNSFWYETFTHDPVLTSEEAAKTRPGYTLEQGAKALIVKVENRNKEVEFAMLVLPAHLRVDSKKVKQSLDTKNLRFATEEEITTITQGVQRGAIPPFGNLFDIKVYADPQLFLNEKIVFNAGDRRFSIAMESKDYKSAVNPTVIDMGDK